jgi:hypothetical protein
MNTTKILENRAQLKKWILYLKDRAIEKNNPIEIFFSANQKGIIRVKYCPIGYRNIIARHLAFVDFKTGNISKRNTFAHVLGNLFDVSTWHTSSKLLQQLNMDTTTPE